MNNFKKLYTLAVLICIFSFVSAGPVFASGHEAEKTSMKDVKKKMSEFIDTVKAYSADQKDEAVQSVPAAMDQLDKRMDELQDRLDQKWDKMDASSRKNARQTMNSLQRQRENLAEWYGGMKHSSKKKWQEVKKGFIESYEKLDAAFEKAKTEF